MARPGVRFWGLELAGAEGLAFWPRAFLVHHRPFLDVKWAAQSRRSPIIRAISASQRSRGGNRFHLIIRWSRGILIARHIHQRSCEEMLSPNVARGFCEEASEEQWVSPLD
jgi:hypothetical protein